MQRPWQVAKAARGTFDAFRHRHPDRCRAGTAVRSCSVLHHHQRNRAHGRALQEEVIDMPRNRYRRRRQLSWILLPVAVGLLAACALVFVLAIEGVPVPEPVLFVAIAMFFAIAVSAIAASVA